MPDPSVSVVIAVYNAQPFLAEAVESLLAQTYTDFEIICVDDGSTDDSGAYLEALAGRESRVRVLHQANGGVARARNAGMAQCRGKYMAVADADDVCVPDRLARQVAFLEQHPHIAAVGGTLLAMSPSGELTGKRHRYPASPARVRRRLRRHCCIPHPAAMARLDAVRAVGGYRPIFRTSSDYDLWLRLNERHACANLREPLVKYRYHPASITVNTLGVEALGSLAAAYCARFRRRHGQDPLDGVTELSPQALHAVDVSQEMIDLNIAYAYISNAKRLARHGADEGARKLLDLYRQTCGESWMRRWLAPYELKVRARVAKNMGRSGESFQCRLASSLQRPLSYCMQLIYQCRGVVRW